MSELKKLSQILKKVALEVANCGLIEDHCQSVYNKSMSIYIHIDPKNPPSITHAPWLGLTIQSYSTPTETNGSVITFDMESAVFVMDADAETEATTQDGSITTLKGFEKLEDLSDLVFDAIDRAVTTSQTQLVTTHNNEQPTNLTITDFPGWVASRVWSISKRI